MKKRVPFSSVLEFVNVSNVVETFSYDTHSITLNIVNRQLVIVSKIIIHKLVMFYKLFFHLFYFPGDHIFLFIYAGL